MTKVYELSNNDIDAVSGGALFLLPVLKAVVGGAGYIGTLQVAADIGAGIGEGFYDATH